MEANSLRRRLRAMSPGPRYAPLRWTVGAVGVMTALAGCGGGGPVHAGGRSDTAPDRLGGPAATGATLVRVGSYAITGATLNRMVGVEQRRQPSAEPLVPPEFSECVARLEAEARSIDERPQAPVQLRRECQTRYRAIAQTVLARLISDEWKIGGAGELGARIGSPALKADRDAMFEARARLAAQAVRRVIKERAGQTTRAQAASYYTRHRFQYLVAGERDLEIARTSSEASAAKVKAEIASGKSFASVVRKLSVPQPLDSSDGSVRELQPHEYGEPNLNEAIFTARPGVLVGPIGTWFGYFVFEVTRIRSEREQPFAHLQATIRRRLSRLQQERALAAFIARWTVKWTARTDCSPGYVVPGCRQFKGPPPLEGLSPP